MSNSHIQNSNFQQIMKFRIKLQTEENISFSRNPQPSLFYHTQNKLEYLKNLDYSYRDMQYNLVQYYAIAISIFFSYYIIPKTSIYKWIPKMSGCIKKRSSKNQTIFSYLHNLITEYVCPPQKTPKDVHYTLLPELPLHYTSSAARPLPSCPCLY